jgi:hypothetical protein
MWKLVNEITDARISIKCMLCTRNAQYLCDYAAVDNFIVGLEWIQGVFSSPFIQKILGFGPSFCIMELNTMQNFWQNGCYSPFWILASRGQKKPKRASRGHNEGNKLCILDGTKYNPENFGILHFITPK